MDFARHCFDVKLLLMHTRQLAAIALLSFAARPSAAATDSSNRGEVPKFSVAFVALDGVRAQDVFSDPELSRVGGGQGEAAPTGGHFAANLRSLAESEGVGVGVPGRGASFRASGPRYVSLPGYLEMLSGRSTSCTHNGCDVRSVSTLLSEVAALPGMTPGEVIAFASWPRLEPLLRGDRRNVWVSAGRRRAPKLEKAAEESGLGTLFGEGLRAHPAPGRERYRPDKHTAALALAWAQRYHPRFLFVGLGDADEHAHRDNYAGYLASIRFADRVIGKLWSWLGEERARGRETLLIVTTDHGRSQGFVHHEKEHESGDVWLVAAGSMVRRRGFVSLSRPGRLRDVVPSMRGLLGLPADRSRRAGRELCGVFRACEGQRD